MACKGTQDNLLSPSISTENHNPNVNQGSCKRKMTSFPNSSSGDQSDASGIAPNQLKGQACADFNLISPPRKHVCGSRRCAAKNPACSVPATVIPRKFLVSKESDFNSSEAAKACKCYLQANPNKEGNEAVLCNCMSSHHSHLRRWSSDDKDCRSFAEVGAPLLFSLSSKPHGRETVNTLHSSQGKAFTHALTDAAHCQLPSSETMAHHESSMCLPIRSWNCLNDLPDSHVCHGGNYSCQNCAETNDASEACQLDSITRSQIESSGAMVEDQGVAVSPSPEKTGNWRLNAVLESFGSLSPTREGRVKTLVRAFESLLSVKDKGGQQKQGGTKPRSYPLQFSYLSSNGEEGTNERGKADVSRTGSEGEDLAAVEEWQEKEFDEHKAWDVLTEFDEHKEWDVKEEHWQMQQAETTQKFDEHKEWDVREEHWQMQQAETTQRQQEHSTAGGDGGGNGALHQCGNEQLSCSPVVPKGEAQEYDYLSARATLIHEQASHSQVCKEEEDKQARQQNCENQEHKLPAGDGTERSHLLQEHVSAPQGKLPTNQKPHSNFQQHLLQRFSMDGHFSTNATRKKACNKSRQPSLGSNCAVSRLWPPLAQKSQMQLAEEKPWVSKPQPFKLLTQERGHMKEQEFLTRLKKLVEEEEKLRVPLAQGLPWTTDEPEIPCKPPVKENTKPLDVHLHTDLRAMERAEFDRFIAEKLLHIEERRMEEERQRRMAEEEEVKRMRQDMVPKAQLMPYFERPFRPRRSSKRPTIPKEPQFQLNDKRSKRQKCVSSSFC